MTVMVINEGERCSLEKQGFVGIYYPGIYRTDRAIIASGGASCDEKLSVAMSRFLRDAGYNVLVLGFYMWEGLPDTLVSIPVDYAERAVHWLKDEKKIQSVAMTAASTGAGYTLLSASLIPEISCIMPREPDKTALEGSLLSLRDGIDGFTGRVFRLACHRYDMGGNVRLVAYPGNGRLK